MCNSCFPDGIEDRFLWNAQFLLDDFFLSLSVPSLSLIILSLNSNWPRYLPLPIVNCLFYSMFMEEDSMFHKHIVCSEIAPISLKQFFNDNLVIRSLYISLGIP